MAAAQKLLRKAYDLGFCPSVTAPPGLRLQVCCVLCCVCELWFCATDFVSFLLF